MARFQFDDDTSANTPIERGTRLAQTIVRGGGFLLLVVGLWIALAVISEAWSLYRHPEQIERIAAAIEHGSNLDQTLAKASQGLAASTPDEADNDRTTSSATHTTSAPAPTFRLSYFVAWMVAILLLMLIGRLSIAAVKAGGELVLYDLHIKRFVRELLREAGGKSRG